MSAEPPAGDSPRRATGRRRSFPVTVTQLPLVRCDVCGQTLAHRPGAAGEVLTEHYATQHSDRFGPADPSEPQP